MQKSDRFEGFLALFGNSCLITKDFANSRDLFLKSQDLGVSPTVPFKRESHNGAHRAKLYPILK
jgi:hypothetical protein